MIMVTRTKIQLKEPFSRNELLKRLPAAAVLSIWNNLCSNMYYTDGSNKQVMIKCFKFVKKFEYSQFECNTNDTHTQTLPLLDL